MNDKISVASAELDSINIRTAGEIEQFRIRFLGSKGILNSLFEEFKNIPSDQKREIGKLLNELKEKANRVYDSLKEKAGTSDAKQEDIDLTLPPDPSLLGTRHPVSIIRKKIIDIFSRVGFTVAEGPEIESEWYNFKALNFADDHPALDMQDTFYIAAPDKSKVVLRTHTSSVQIRVMEKTPPPVRVICPGRVYRNETITARAHCFFHQVEGLYVDTGVSLADLKDVLFYFAREMFGKDLEVRFRPSYFPFTEPSAEMDISCIICKKKGCPVCKHSGWVEILGCGMVHPAVLENCKIDSSKHTGYAFGMGIERIAMLKYRINDIRLFFENDVRFLKQFAGAV